MFNDHILTEFIKTFYGYGNYQARFWFVGMEEGGGETIADLLQRLEVWDKRGRNELEDVAKYHNAIGLNGFFENNPKLQRSWKQLIRIVLTATKQDSDIESVKNYQKNLLGRIDGDTCLLELLPLPSPNTGTWFYASNSSIPHLISRKVYREHFVGPRIIHLQNRLYLYKPKVVVFYGRTYVKYWKQISDVETWVKLSDGIEYGMKNNILFVITLHPVARKTSNEYFNQVGRLISEKKS